ncbi:MAG: trimethylamine methyltransferase family protein [Spirochaetota bacterium]|nr:MAG: trimethylamine methyltransferase family protein [Spirochaetota bacterium]
MRPLLKVLSDEELKEVHEASLAILEKTGMLIDHEKARDILAETGAKVDHETRIVKYPPELIEEKLKLVPKKFIRRGRTEEFDIASENDGEIYARVAGGATGYIDLETGEHRRARLDDWKEFAKLADALPTIGSIATLHCGDIPEKVADIHSLHVLLEHQRNNVVHNAFTIENHKYIIEMLIAVSGSKDRLKERPFVHHMISPISPLFLNEDDTAQLLLACEYGIPTDIPIMSIGGTTSPITVAGTLAQANAEYLGTMALAQTVNPGHTMPYFIDPVVADMRTCEILMGAPEVGLLVAAIAQLGSDLYGLPTEGIGLTCDGFVTEQALFQKAQNTLMLCLAGGTLNLGAGIVEGVMALSPAQLVIDDEIVKIARRLARGIEVNGDTLAVEVIERVGPRNHFLEDMHTLKHIRTGELMDTEIFDRCNRETWESMGKKDLVQKASEKAFEILKKHEVEPLPEDVSKELKDIVRKAEKELAK